LYIKPE